jgi:primosomal protein N' (replication factor Y)
VTYVKVAIAKLHTGRKLFTYKSSTPVSSGNIVEISFGNKKALGIVIDKTQKPSIQLKSLNQKLEYCLPKESLRLLQWMFDFYPDDYGLITQLFVPLGLQVKNRSKVEIIKGHNDPLPKPTPEQSLALKAIFNKKNTRVMLHGDTGTGKTRVFMEKITQAINSGKSVLVLTPEIGLTPQLVNDMSKHIDAPIALNHSKLTNAQRRKIWQHALSTEKPTIFTGPRSTLFLPFKNIGLVVIDESHDTSYKQNSAPRYQSLHIASFLASQFKAQIIQSTATPNIDDYNKAKTQGYKFIRMKQTAAGSHKSETHFVDITDRQQFTKSPYLSNKLIASIEKALKSKEQTMLFLNRRGSARLLQCNDCGWQAFCPNCGLPLIYHHDIHIIRCHSCSHKEKSPNFCPQCKSTNLLFKNIGTKSLYEHTSKLF